MIYDKNGKIFGKINIVDVLIILVLIVLSFGVWIKFYMPKHNNQAANTESAIEIIFFQEEVPDYVANSMNIGDVVVEVVQNTELGQVKEVKTGKSLSWDQTPKGESIPSSKQGYFSIQLKVKGKGIFTGKGVKIGTGTYFIGKSLEIRAGNTAFYPRISEIKKTE